MKRTYDIEDGLVVGRNAAARRSLAVALKPKRVSKPVNSAKEAHREERRQAALRRRFECFA